MLARRRRCATGKVAVRGRGFATEREALEAVGLSE